MTAPYIVALVAFGIAPAAYVVALTFQTQSGGLTLFGNFATVFADFRFGQAFANVAGYSLVFLVPSMLVAIMLAFFMQPLRPATASGLQLAYYIPQALAGTAGVVLWLFMLTPTVSPVRSLLNAFDFANIIQVIDGFGMAPVMATIAIWTSGNAILLMYAALKSIPLEIVEAATIDGAGPWRIAISIKLPMLRKWIAYTGILSLAACTQLFVEPQLISGTTQGALGTNWSPLQLALTFAYRYYDFGAASALSLILLVIGGVAAWVVVRFTGLFRVEI